MLEVERVEFAQFLPSYIGKNADKEAMLRWWRALKPFELGAVKEAFVRRDQEMSGYPEPFQIVERCKRVPLANSAPAPQTHWTRQDLVVACNFASIDWANAGRAGPADWVQRVERAYDAGMADAAQRIVGKRTDLKPREAAKVFLDDYESKQGAWFLPVDRSVQM